MKHSSALNTRGKQLAKGKIMDNEEYHEYCLDCGDCLSCYGYECYCVIREQENKENNKEHDG